MKKLSFLVVAASALTACAAIEIVSPKMGATVEQLRPVQRDFILQSKESRDKYFDGAENAAALRKDGTTPQPIVLEWKGDKADYTVTLKRLPDGKTFFTASVPSNRVEVDSLEIARDWEWTVSGGGETATGRFRTEDLWPRLIRIDGTINARDIGGMIGLNGRRVKQGLVFRTAGLNHNAPIEYYSNEEIMQLYKDGKLMEMGEAGKHLAKKLKKGGKLHSRAKSNGLVKRKCYAPGKVRLSEAERVRVLKDYGFKSDVDLRRDDECFGMTGSPLGPEVKWWQFHDAEGKSGYSAYAGAFSERGTNLNQQVFRIFMDPKNYPIVFHCIGGADRTGTVGLILEALLGVSEDMMWKDYLTTGFVGVVSDPPHKRNITGTFEALGKTPGATWAEKAERYFLDLGFTAKEIADLREFLLEK